MVSEHVTKHYSTLGTQVVENLKKRNFEAYYCATKEEAAQKALSLIPQGDVVSWGGSITLDQLGLREMVHAGNFTVMDRDRTSSQAEREEMMRQTLLCDTFLTGTNAISADGQLINIDGGGNRVAAITYGPKQVIVVVGMNKVAPTLEAAWQRARNIAAPTNVQRYNADKTPCYYTGSCEDCKTANTLCAFMHTTRFCKPAGRIKVILVGEALGF